MGNKIYRHDKDSPTHDFTITEEDHGEHHMSSYLIYLETSEPIEGVSRFKTTNGRSFFTPDGHGAILHDSCIILYVDLNTMKAYHKRSPENLYFGNVRIEGDAILSDLYGRDVKDTHPPIKLADITSSWEPGLGKLADGRFPSAYG